jgi:hypothetical protein
MLTVSLVDVVATESCASAEDKSCEADMSSCELVETFESVGVASSESWSMRLLFGPVQSSLALDNAVERRFLDD